MNILSIGGSDPSSGAGIQNDIKTITELDAYCLTIITAITSQNTEKFFQVEPVSSKMIISQIDSILSDFKIDAIKIGMVYNSSIIKAIKSKLRYVKVPIILDPVIKSTTGGELIEKNAIRYYKKMLMPLAFVITPNTFEAEVLTNTSIKNEKDLLASAKKIKNFGTRNVVITGNNFGKQTISDFILENSNHYSIKSKKISKSNHGSGCTFSSALAVCIARKMNFRDSVEFAKKFTIDSIKNAKKVGKGIPVTQANNYDLNKKNLKKAIDKFTKIKNAYSLIPECQTNFVFSKQIPISIKDVVGVSGRIVKSGTSVIVAGDLEYGGSTHVASAIIAMNKKFKTIRSALNIKYNKKILEQFKKKGFNITSYDRSKEPSIVKNKENSSISWGIKKAIKEISKPPDIVYHKGDYGKEPMILIFGKNPGEVIHKISKLS